MSFLRQSVNFESALKVHFSPSYAGEEKFINEHIVPDYGIKLEAVGLKMAEGKFAVSIYRHQWRLKQVVEALTPSAEVFWRGFGIYSDKYETIEEIPKGTLAALPFGGANQAQALWLLRWEGLLGLNKNVKAKTAKLRDITENPYEFKEFELETLPRWIFP